MTADAHQTTSLGWRIAITLQRSWEWIEFRFTQLNLQSPHLPDWPWLKPFLQGLFWMVALTLTLGLAWLIYGRIQAYLDQRHPRSSPVSSQIPPQDNLQRAEQWWQQAQNLATQGEYGAACRAIYMAALLRLNETHQVPYLASRTNREYLQCLGQAHQPRAYKLLLRTHERITFGNVTATATLYQRCEQAYREILK